MTADPNHLSIPGETNRGSTSFEQYVRSFVGAVAATVRCTWFEALKARSVASLAR